MASQLFAAEIAKQQGGGGSDSKAIDMKKYERMKKMGLPMNSIVNRMRMDGVDSDSISKFGGSAMKKGKTTADEKQIMPSTAIPSIKMKPFHWAKINQHQSTSTIWKEIESEVPKICKQINFSEIEALFNKESETTQKKKEKSVKRDHQLIDPKRAQNVMIGLAQIKMSEDDLLDAILKMDDKKLSVDKLRSLLPYVPSDGELQMVRDYVKNGGNVNELSKVEQFFVKMMDMVGIRQRVSLWIFKSEFPSILENVQRRITGVSQAIDALKESENLKKVLYIILVVGNFLNAKSSRGNAFGFLMEPTLDLLDGTKSADKKMSLMLFVVELIEKIEPNALEWINELEILERVYKIKTNAILNDLDAIKRDMGAIEKYLKAQRRTMTKMASDWAREGTAVSVNQIASHIRKLSKSGPQALFNGCETYATLKFSDYEKVGMGMPGKIGVNFGKKDDLKSDEMEENMFGKVMILFHKKQNSKVTEVETFLKKTQMDCKKLSAYFGFEEEKKWEEVLLVFHLFREQFSKALRELTIKRQKEQRKLNQNEKKNQLAAKLAKQPKKSDVVKTMNLDMDSNDNDGSDKKSTSSSQKGKASAMYAAFVKNKKSNAAHSTKTWV